MHYRIKIKASTAAYILLVFFVLASLAPVRANQRTNDNLKEFSLKVAFTYSFSKFVKWPIDSFKSKDSPIMLCVMDVDEHRSVWNRINGKSAQGRTLKINYVERIDNNKICHMLFVGIQSEKPMDSQLKPVFHQPVLTLADYPDFINQGGMISLAANNNRVQFSMNLVPSNRVGLVISSRLIALAKQVIEHEEARRSP